MPSPGFVRSSIQVGQERDADTPADGTSAPPSSFEENAQNRGNELEDLLQTQGISENVPAKRTAFDAQNAAIDTLGARQTPAKEGSVAV